MIDDTISLTLNLIKRRPLLGYYREIGRTEQEKQAEAEAEKGSSQTPDVACYIVLLFGSRYPFHFVRLTASLPLQALCMP